MIYKPTDKDEAETDRFHAERIAKTQSAIEAAAKSDAPMKSMFAADPDDAAEHAAFEKYTRQKWPEADHTFERDGDDYRETMLNTAWLGWKARADLLSNAVDAGEIKL